MAGPRVAVFSDVHGNLPGLLAVLEDIEARGPFDAIVAAGDHCLNGPEPAEALDLVLQAATHVLYGNTDRDIVDEGVSDPDLGQKKADSIAWTREQLGARRIATLSGLAFDHKFLAPNGLVLQVVHANPHDVDRHIFPDHSDEELRDLLGETRVSMLVFGHLHIPFTRKLDDTILVNIAAAGLPRDGDRRATWGAFAWEAETGWVSETYRIEYDFRETVKRIFSSGMPHAEKRAEDLLKATYD